MIRTPHEPDNGLFLPLGDKVTKPENKPRVAPPFTEYTPIKGRPGWEDDGHGHQRYDGLPDAQRNERVVENKRVGLYLAQMEQHSLATLHAFDAQMDAQALPGDETHAELQANVLCAKHDGRTVDVSENRKHEPKPWTLAPVHLVRHFSPYANVEGFECSNGHAFYTQPIPGCSVSILEGDTRGRGPLVEWDPAVFVPGTGKVGELKRYLCGLRNCVPKDVSLFQRKAGVNESNLWTRTDIPPL